jgi:P4 family phage/plasmid primase-like protien
MQSIQTEIMPIKIGQSSNTNSNKLKRKSLNNISMKKESSSQETQSLSDFLKSHMVKKGDNQENPKEITNTRIGDKKTNTFGGSYHIPDDEYDTFLKIYYNEIIQNNREEFLTEKQLPENGPILIDIDLRYDYDTTEKHHTKDHVFDLLCLYLDQLQKIFQFENDTEFPVFIFEKPDVNRVKDKNITKDGIHIIIGLQANHTIQFILRKKIMNEIQNVWTDLPIKNTWEEVFDEGITKGCVNWQLYGSRKPNHQPYVLKYAYNIKKDANDGEIITEEIDTTNYVNEGNICKLSARYQHHPSLLFVDSFIDEYDRQNKKSKSAKNDATTAATSVVAFSYDSNMSDNAVLNVRTKEELTALVNHFLEQITFAEYELREAYDYTMTLPDTYYGEGSFVKWIRVGWALRNISNRLFIVWVAFSAQSNSFNYSFIRDDLWGKWVKFDRKNLDGLTKRSIMYWSKQDAKDKFLEVQKKSIDFYINQTIENMKEINSNSDSKTIKGCTDYDLASVLFQMYKDEYVCVSVKSNVWYKFKDHKWSEIDSGTTLRKSISETLRELYSKKMQGLAIKLRLIEDIESVQYKCIKKEQRYICDIIEKLGSTKHKQNIMTEAKEIFYDEKFLKNLDTNPYLLCFKNGVIDFKEKTFRRGYPDDCISKSTNINYLDLKTIEKDQEKRKIIKDIEDFMHKLFPNSELYQYMWQHLASTLIGISAVQTFNMYIGIGQNGKSVLVSLMEQVLGDYKGDVPLTLLTQQRTKIGGLAPELVQLKGVRYAVMQEPSKGDKINEGIMKQITGGDPIQARAPYMTQTISYIPQFKLVVCSNEFMEIKSRDHGTWRRIRVVDFESLFTENPVTDDPDKPHQFKIDKYIKEKFEIWKEVFASILVNISYEKNGMVDDCSKVMASSNSYRQQQDYITEFIFEKTEKCTKQTCVHKNTLHNLFKEWYNVNYSGKITNMKELDANMEKIYGKNRDGVWVGVKIKHYNESFISNDDEKTENESNDGMDITFEEL